MDTGLQKTPARNRFDHLYKIIRERICLLVYPPGSKLYEDRLAEEFEVSKSPIRRVLARLEADGLVEVVHGVGVIVVDLSDDELKHAYQLRTGLLDMFGRMAIEHVPKNVISQFKEADALLTADGAEMSAEDLSRFKHEYCGFNFRTYCQHSLS